MAGCRACQFKPSDMNVKITIEQLSLAKTDTGGSVKTWTTFATPWVKVEEKGGNEANISQRITAENVYVFSMRYISNVNESMRIIHRGLTLQIKSVMQVEGLKDFIKIKAVQEGQGT